LTRCVSVRLCLSPPPPRSTLSPYTTLFRSIPAPVRGLLRPCPSSFSTVSSGVPPVLTRPTRRRRHREPSTAAPREFPHSPHPSRSEEHTSELQSRENLVCRLLLEKKNTNP